MIMMFDDSDDEMTMCHACRAPPRRRNDRSRRRRRRRRSVSASAEAELQKRHQSKLYRLLCNEADEYEGEEEREHQIHGHYCYWHRLILLTDDERTQPNMARPRRNNHI